MKLRKHGVEILCEQCMFVRGDSSGDFEIAVPVSLNGARMAGTAKLHCVISGDRHQIELTELRDATLRAVQPSPEVMEKVSAALESVARHRICGNRHICPPNVVWIVEAQRSE